ncbi:hypothetical protein [Nocardioides astragali]|uniref:Capsular polysaccharide synthesis protein n=1 Tax=Nocardioides astragali TaxID=1776736 RepID=A0ABW2N1B6_9ACTN|nr:hypothetical protein [Nocardioides astragali]
MALTQLAREAKHAAWLRRKRVTDLLTEVRWGTQDRMLTAWSRISPPQYSNGDYLDSFVSRTPKSLEEVPASVLPRRVFCLWTGDNGLTPNRSAALAQLRTDNPAVEVVLVTADNLVDWVVPDSPLPPAYADLSLVHRSDYLRCYLMHHHGGGYADIKRDYGDLASCFDRLDANPDKWVLGYPEVSARDVSDEAGSIYRSLQRHHRRLPANGAFIARPGTPLTAEWFAEVSRRLDRFAQRLAATPGNVLGDNNGYPVPWGALQGATFQPMCFKYADRILVDERLRPSLENYR